MLEYTVRPIESWPGKETPSYARDRSPFWVKWSDTLDLLERELRELRGKNVVMQLDVELFQLRNDGMIRAGAIPRTPRVILSFDSKHGPLSYPCDRFSDWQANVRAIALALEALRKVDRYGVTRQAEQYKGWAKLPAPGAAMSRSEAASIIAEHSGIPASDILGSPATLVDAYRKAAAKTHPDAGGDPNDSALRTEGHRRQRSGCDLDFEMGSALPTTSAVATRDHAAKEKDQNININS